MQNAVAKRRFVRSTGLTLVADNAGDPANPAVILMHGGGQSRHFWSEASQRLVAEGYHVVNQNVPSADQIVAGDRNDAFGDCVISFLKRVHPSGR